MKQLKAPERVSGSEGRCVLAQGPSVEAGTRRGPEHQNRENCCCVGNDRTRRMAGVGPLSSLRSKCRKASNL